MICFNDNATIDALVKHVCLFTASCLADKQEAKGRCSLVYSAVRRHIVIVGIVEQILVVLAIRCKSTHFYAMRDTVIVRITILNCSRHLV